MQMQAPISHCESGAAEGLFGAEKPIAGITEAGHDIGMVVQALIQGGTENRHIRMVALQAFYAFRCGDQAHEFDAVDALLFKERDRG